MKFFSVIVLLLSLGGCVAASASETLKVTSADGVVHVFNVEVARTSADITRGLMFRQSLPADGGMLFDLGQEKDVAFWMKNTLIPLDMLFISRSGEVVKIHPQAQPKDLTPIPSEQPVIAVLEINGGRAAMLGLAKGSHVSGVLWP